MTTAEQPTSPALDALFRELPEMPTSLLLGLVTDPNQIVAIVAPEFTRTRNGDLQAAARADFRRALVAIHAEIDVRIPPRRATPPHFPLPDTGLAARLRAVRTDALDKLREDVRAWDTADLFAHLLHVDALFEFVATAHGLDPANLPPTKEPEVREWCGAMSVAICDVINHRIPGGRS